MSILKKHDRFLVTHDLAFQLARLNQAIGQNNYYRELTKSDFYKILENTVNQDVYFLTQLLGISLSETRLRLLITKNSKPRSRNEQLVSNLKQFIMNYRTGNLSVDFTAEALWTLFEHLLPNNTKLTSKTTAEAEQNAQFIDDTYQLYKHLQGQNDRLILNIHYYLDLTLARPFSEINNLYKYLLLYLLVLDAGCCAYDYVSFFQKILSVNSQFIEEFNKAAINWSEGYAQTLDFVRFIVKMCLESYHLAHQNLQVYRVDQNVNKATNIAQTIEALPNEFTKNDIRHANPYISESTINRVLASMKEAGEITPVGKGRGAKWQKIAK